MEWIKENVEWIVGGIFAIIGYAIVGKKEDVIPPTA